MEWLEQLKTNTITALRFFTRLPIPDQLQLGNGEFPKLNEAATGFPLAGFVIALFPATIWYFTSNFLPSLVAAGLAIAIGALVTGALHEDGLADCADGLGGATTKERALEIMRDSTIGTYGASVLFFSFALRIAALASLTPLLGTLALLMAHSTARASMIIAISTTQYVRSSGLGDSVKQGANQDQMRTTLGIALGLGVLITIVSSQYMGIIAPIAGLVAAWIVLQYLKSRIGGYTGDGLGAIEQITEITIMVVLAGIWS